MEILLKIVGITASLFAFYKIIVDVLLAKSSKYREEYSFSKEYLKDIHDVDTHPYTLQRGFKALTGHSYTVPEMKYILSFANPSRIIKYRISADSFIDFKDETCTFEWKNKYKSRTILTPKMYLFVYVVLAFLALSPFYITDLKSLTGLPIILTSTSLGVLAIASLIKSENFKIAIELMDFQNERSTTV